MGYNANGAEGDLLGEVPKKEFKLYPNPVIEDKFTIDSDEKIVEVKVLNLLGQEVYNARFLNESVVRIELETPEKGLYLVQIKTNDNQVATKRILFK